ncbi:hypothetical protein [Streptomyces ipomoeae]|uniref:hypothetical protein n=1 Tax=Streptomyces ipomoeae TaxID=103232 RepID=UPI00114686AA|nr:hypothetical protein [Streptomyces ipomoeae]TQE33193.1 hypothetical protein Sipo7851_22135 [Streptomyces ipomoeae]
MTARTKVKVSKKRAADFDDEYEGPSRSTVAMVLALLVGVLSLIDYFCNGRDAAIGHLTYFAVVVLVFRVFFGLVFHRSDEPDDEPDPGP